MDSNGCRSEPISRGRTYEDMAGEGEREGEREQLMSVRRMVGALKSKLACFPPSFFYPGGAAASWGQPCAAVPPFDARPYRLDHRHHQPASFFSPNLRSPLPCHNVRSGTDGFYLCGIRSRLRLIVESRRCAKEPGFGSISKGAQEPRRPVQWGQEA